MTMNLDITGYFKFACEPCQAARKCTFGCGREPKTLCKACFGENNPRNYLPIIGVEDEPDCLCDGCGDLF